METFQLLRALHILFAIAWAGAAMYSHIVIKNALKLDDHARWRFYADAKHNPYMAITATLAILFGGSLFSFGDYSMDGLGGGFFFFHFAAGFAVLAWLVGAIGHAPNGKKLAAASRKLLAGEEAPIAHLESRQRVLDILATAFIGLALFGMLTFRFFM